MMYVRERYFNDANFHRMVDTMVVAMLECRYTPSEMREAAVLASIMYYEKRPQGLIVPADKMHELLNHLEAVS